MKYTNKLNLPQPIYNAVVGQDKAYRDSHKEPYDISVTELISPPQQSVLKRQHADDLESDISDMSFALLGSAMHKVLEDGTFGPIEQLYRAIKNIVISRENEYEFKDALSDAGHCLNVALMWLRRLFKPSKDIAEKRYYAEVAGWVVSGMVDRYSPTDNVIQDYKVLSVWEHIMGLSFEKVAQLNILNYLIGEGSKLEIVAIFRDWQKSKAKTDSNYPQSSCMVIPVEPWSKEQAVQYIEERVELHRAARNGDIIPCTEEDRWATQTKYAVMKGDNKRAVKLCDNHKQAFAMAETDKKFWVQKRPGVSKRCADYCPVGGATGICKQWVAEKSNG